MSFISRSSLCCIAVLGLLGGASATVSAATPTTADADHAALRALVPLYEQAVADGKPAALKPHLDPAFSAGMLTGDALDTPESLDAYWTKIQTLLGDGGHYRVKVNVGAPAVIDGDLAVASGTTDDIVDAQGRHFEFHSNWTAVCRRGADGWKLLRIQATIDPIYNPFVQTAVHRTMTMAAIVAGVAGLVIGVGIGAIAFRRRAAGGPRP